MFKDDLFLDILETKPLIEILDSILGNTSIIYAYQSSSLPPCGTNYSNRVHVDSPRFIPNYPTNIGVIFPLIDFNKYTGATKFLPRSHQCNLMPEESFFNNNSVQAECKAGSMIVFNARTFHKGGINYSDKPRHAITINFCRSFMRQRFYFAKMCSKSLESKLTLNQRRLLGFNVRMPESLEEFYLPESERLYQPNQG